MEMTKPLIYAIDDDKVVLLTYTHKLKHDYDLVTFTSAEALFTALEIVTPALIICDLCMPFVPGAEVMHRIKKEHPEIPFVIATGMEGEEHEVAARSKGFGYYSKTQPLQKLEEEICRILT